MKIGILTYYRVANFGANLQAVSTYYHLVKRGHHPILIYYEPTYSTVRKMEPNESKQAQVHYEFLDSLSLNETPLCRDSHEVMNAINKFGIEAVIVGSDAVVQHHPLLSRIHRGRRKPFWIGKKAPDKSFPNPFWGVGIDSSISMAMMSVSSQNSQYRLFSKRLRSRMANALGRMKYISVRDEWTKQMMLLVLGKQSKKIHLTPDPVFAFNYNAKELIPSEVDIRNYYKLPHEYILVCLNAQNLKETQLQEMKEKFAAKGKCCVAFTLPLGIKFRHPFDVEINVPLPPLDWYAIIKYSSGYVGCNMHPIVVSLHNAVPCFSIDNWGTRNFWGHSTDNGSSKVADILGRFGLKENRTVIENGKCVVSTDLIVDKILNFPREEIRKFSAEWTEVYKVMMDDILCSFK